jgi:DNA invertase Pin-like site-specific DNA recombinase
MTTKTAKIRKLLSEGKTTEEIVEKLKVKRQTVYGVRYYDKIRKEKQHKIVTQPTLWQKIKQFFGG